MATFPGNRKKFFRVIIAVLAATLVMLQLNLYIGFRFGPHPVQAGETLYGILMKVFDGSEFHTTTVIEKWNLDINPALLYANKDSQARDGDVVTVRNNTLTILRPDGVQHTTNLVDAASFHNRTIELWFRNILVIVMAAVIVSFSYFLIDHWRNAVLYRRMLKNLAIALVIALCLELGFYIARYFGEYAI